MENVEWNENVNVNVNDHVNDHVNVNEHEHVIVIVNAKIEISYFSRKVR